METTNESWKHIGELFGELIEQEPSARSEALDRLRLENPTLAAELSSLLEAHDSAETFLENRVERAMASVASKLLSDSLDLPDFVAGDRLLHFQMREFLGAGSLAKVYLARDTRLDRLVALKICWAENREAKTLANFSLDGIVQVYSEHTDRHGDRALRIICLQYIPGLTLAKLQKRIAGAESLVGILDELPSTRAAFDAGAFEWRQRLSRAPLADALVLLVKRVAEILDHAHTSRILHLDIKPENILLDVYGRPFVSDFNVSSDGTVADGCAGGTPYYMSPEQARRLKGENVPLDGRSDVFALGVVLRDLLVSANIKNRELNEIIARATHSDLDRRFAGAKEFAESLTTWLRLASAERELPEIPRGLERARIHPLWLLIGLNLAAQLFASIINIVYNQLQIVSRLTAEQNATFFKAVPIWNVVCFSVCILTICFIFKPLFKVEVERDIARRLVLKIPRVMLFIISTGWFIGGNLFPIVIDKIAGPVPLEVYWQFYFSFALALLISLTTSLSLSLFVVTRILYPKYWSGCPEQAKEELRSCERINRMLVLIAGLVPMVGILMAVLFSPLGLTLAHEQSFRIFCFVLVGFGLANLTFVQRISIYVDTVCATLKRRNLYE
jgi:serine/threonine protein kinase